MLDGMAGSRCRWTVGTGLLGALSLVGWSLLVGCAGDDGAADVPTTRGPGEYLPGLGVSVDLPAEAPAAVVVLVPGGGWQTADPESWSPLAADLADNGLAAVTITYGTSSTDSHYPRPVDDIACAVAYAAEQVPGVPVVLLGHSAGAELVALVGLVPDREDATCPYAPYAPDAVVGLAGPYDVSRVGDIAESLFGVPESDDPELWRDGNPFTWTAERPDVPYLLVFGEADDVVPEVLTDDFAAALTEGGHDVTVEKLPGVTHETVYTAPVIGDLLVAWITAEFPS